MMKLDAVIADTAFSFIENRGTFADLSTGLVVSYEMLLDEFISVMIVALDPEEDADNAHSKRAYEWIDSIDMPVECRPIP